MERMNKVENDPRQMRSDERVGSVTGGVNIAGGSNITVGGDVVGRDKITTKVNYASAGVDAGQLVELVRQFAAIRRTIDGLSDIEEEDKEDLKTNVQRIEEEVKKGEAADTPRVERSLKKIAAMSGDIFQVVVATLSSPAAGIARAIQLIAQKAREAE
jgi:hypothetical protein